MLVMIFFRLWALLSWIEWASNAVKLYPKLYKDHARLHDHILSKRCTLAEIEWIIQLIEQLSYYIPSLLNWQDQPSTLKVIWNSNMIRSLNSIWKSISYAFEILSERSIRILPLFHISTLPLEPCMLCTFLDLSRASTAQWNKINSYQPMINSLRNSKVTTGGILVQMSPHWSLVSILTISMPRTTICSLNQIVFNA